MSSERIKVKLGDIVDIFTGFPFKSAQYSENPGDIKLIRGDNIAQGVLRWDGVKRWPVSGTEKLDSFWLKENDVLLAMDRPWIPAGLKFARVYLSDLPCLLVQRVACLRAKSGQDQNFIYSLLSTPAFSEYIQNVTTGTAVPHISVKQIKEFELEKLTLADEREIGLIHGIIDSRIKLLRETNATLEAIAQALFKSWFVDFDPVHANAGTQAPSLPAEIQALFPSHLVETSQGLIPEGWEVGCLADILSLRNEKVKAGPKTAALHYVPIESITAKSPFLNEYKSGQEANSSLILFRKGDILFGAMRPYFHKVCLAPVDGVTRTTVFTLTPKDNASTAFALLTLFQESTIAFATQHSEGSTIPYAKWKNSLELMTTIVPPYEIQRAFNKLVAPIIESAYANIEKSKILAELRDTLLPRLISGQLSLPETEAALAELG